MSINISVETNSFPSELIQVIIEFLDDRSRRDMALSCKVFQHLTIQVEKREFKSWMMIINSFLIQPFELRKLNNTSSIPSEEDYENRLRNIGIHSLYIREFFKTFIVPPKSSNRKTEFHPSCKLWPLAEWTSKINENGELVWTIGEEVVMCNSMVSFGRKQIEHFKYWILRFYRKLYKDSFANDMTFLYLTSLRSNLYKRMTFVESANTEPLSFASKEIKSNRSFMLQRIRSAPKIFNYVVDLYNNDLEIVQSVVMKIPTMIKLASQELKDNDSLARIVLPLDGLSIKEFSDRIRGIFEFGLLAVSSNGYALQYLSDELKQNREVVLKAVDKDGQVLSFAPDFWDEREIVLTAVKSSGNALIFASDNLKRDREIVLTAVQQDPNAFSCLYKARDPDIIVEWGEDEELVLLSQNITFASERLKNCKSFVLKFIEINPNSYNYISPELMNDREVVLSLVTRQGSMLEYVNTEYRSKPKLEEVVQEKISNRDIVIAALRSDGYALRFTSLEWRNTFDIVMIAVQNDGLALKYASNEMKDCDEIVIEAIKQNYYALEYVSHRLQVSPEIIELSQVLKKR